MVCVNLMARAVVNHPVRLRLPPLHRRGMVCVNLVAQGSFVRAERYFREGMLALPYGWFGYALYQYIILCKYSEMVCVNLMAQAVLNHLVRLCLPPLHRRGIKKIDHENLSHHKKPKHQSNRCQNDHNYYSSHRIYLLN